LTILTVAMVAVWIVVLALTTLVILLYRQFGLLYIGSRGRIDLTGVAVGARAPENVELVDAQGGPLSWPWDRGRPDRQTVMIFGAPSCPLCERVLAQLTDFGSIWRDVADVVFVDQGTPQESSRAQAYLGSLSWTYAFSPDGALHHDFDVEAYPFAFVVDSQGAVTARGLVNDSDHLEQLLSDGATRDGLEEALLEAAANAPGGPRNERRPSPADSLEVTADV